MQRRSPMRGDYIGEVLWSRQAVRDTDFAHLAHFSQKLSTRPMTALSQFIEHLPRRP
jgi:hypothetical protein